MKTKEAIVGHIYEEFKPKFFADYGFIIYRVITENSKLYMIKEKTIRTTFLRESIIYRLEHSGFVTLEKFKKRFDIEEEIPIREDNLKNKIKNKIL